MRAEAPGEVRMVERVSRPLDRVDADRKLDRGVHAAHRVRPATAPRTPRIQQRNVASQRKTGQRVRPRKPLRLDRLQHRVRVVALSGVVERGGERLGAAAIAEVDADDRPPSRQGLQRGAPHVARFGRTGEAVDRDERPPRRPGGSRGDHPDLRSGRDGNVDRLGGAAHRAGGKERRHDRLHVGAAQPRCGREFGEAQRRPAIRRPGPRRRRSRRRRRRLPRPKRGPPGGSPRRGSRRPLGRARSAGATTSPRRTPPRPGCFPR